MTMFQDLLRNPYASHLKVAGLFALLAHFLSGRKKSEKGDTFLYLGIDRVPGTGFSGLHRTRTVADLPELQDLVTSLDLQRKPHCLLMKSHFFMPLKSQQVQPAWISSLTWGSHSMGFSVTFQGGCI